jgi:hypothetical protein
VEVAITITIPEQLLAVLDAYVVASSAGVTRESVVSDWVLRPLEAMLAAEQTRKRDVFVAAYQKADSTTQASVEAMLASALGVRP